MGGSIHPPVSADIRLLLFEAVTNKAAGNVHIPFFVWTNVWSQYLGIEFLGLRIRSLALKTNY